MCQEKFARLVREDTWHMGRHSHPLLRFDGDSAAADAAANGRKEWECYALEPDSEDNNATNDFRITASPMKTDGTSDLAHIVFDPPQARRNVPGARAVVKGAVMGRGWGGSPLVE